MDDLNKLLELKEDVKNQRLKDILFDLSNQEETGDYDDSYRDEYYDIHTDNYPDASYS